LATPLVAAGGKRVRPLVVLLVYHASAGERPLLRRADATLAAVALELIHSATLLHDDIIDRGETRRGRPSAPSTFGVADTLVTGDFLFSRAFALCARFEPEVIRWAAEACISLTEGEIMQGRFRHNPAVTVADYLEIVERKTASLFAAGARRPAHLAGAPPALVAPMGSPARHLALAFQMSDDLLDVEGQPALTGKPRGVDLRDGNPSLPIVLALARDGELARLFASERLVAADIEAGLARIRLTGVLTAVAERARAHTAAEIETVARAALAVGFRKLRLTGGEPTLRADLLEIVARLARLPGLGDLTMTTNGVRLPALAAPLAAAGLRRVNIHLDSLD